GREGPQTVRCCLALLRAFCPSCMTSRCTRHCCAAPARATRISPHQPEQANRFGCLPFATGSTHETAHRPLPYSCHFPGRPSRERPETKSSPFSGCPDAAPVARWLLAVPSWMTETVLECQRRREVVALLAEAQSCTRHSNEREATIAD